MGKKKLFCKICYKSIFCKELNGSLDFFFGYYIFTLTWQTNFVFLIENIFKYKKKHYLKYSLEISTSLFATKCLIANQK